MKTIIEHNEILLRANRNLEAAVATQAGIIARQREALKEALEAVEFMASAIDADEEDTERLNVVNAALGMEQS